MQKPTSTTMLLVFLLAGMHAPAWAQIPDLPQAIPVLPDTTTPSFPDTLSQQSSDTTGVDSLIAAQSPSGIDSVVSYVAKDSIIYSLRNRTMYLHGTSSIRYKEMGIKAEYIDVNWNTSVLNAQGVPDASDTSKTGIRGAPDLIDGNETYRGQKISYNFKTKKGKIDVGKTELEGGYYRGEEIKKIGTDVLFVADGKYTTCDADHPHYYFGSPEMKISLKQNIVARPIYLYVSDVPVFALPFGIFPTERGRRSGIIGPAYGESNRGRYLLHLGYYWAINDYLDWSVTGDGYTKGSWVLYSNFRYALRYNFSGGINASYAKTISGERGDPNYSNQRVFNIHVGHNQEFNPTTRLVVDFTFTSGSSYYQNVSYRLDDLLRQEIYSNATLSKSWEGTPNSLTLNVSRRQNLTAQPGQLEISDALPNLSFNRGQSFPFRSKSSSGGSSSAWYDLIGYTYGGQLLNTRNQYKADTLGVERVEERRGVQHNVTINASPKLGYFTITPFFNYTEKWYEKGTRRELETTIGEPDTSGNRDTTYRVIDTEFRRFKAVRVFSMGISAGTKFYGIVQPNILGIKGIRHQVKPSLSYTYQPDFSKPSFGYFGTYVDQFGRVQKYGFYDREVFGGAPGEERQAIGLRIENVIEMKTESSDSAGQENKFQLLNFDVSTGYNFARDSLKFDPISIGYRTNIGTLLNISGSTSFNLYKFEPDPLDPRIGRRVNKFLVKETGQLAQLTNFNISLSTSLSGEKKKSTAGPVLSAADSLRQQSGTRQLYDDPVPDFSIPWRLDLSYNFSQSQEDPRNKFRSSNLSASLSFSLTENWKISASTNYDLVNRIFAAPQVSVYRDLHCWEMTFNWVPTGPNRNYRLEIRLKAPQLQDIKVTKQESARNIF
ncbi:MAG: LPS-assembly protein LptD [Bacteroidetes bacterium]|nr:LPS-assembly protein LptD [Bacteroidota bacterium]MCW5896952.1 LPS-assembly protein LptD [Bacteroidota bacterium]